MTHKQNKNIQISLLLVATLGVMSGITIVSSLPLISHTFTEVPHIEFLSKLMLTIPSIIIALFAPFAGHIVDKFGRLKPLYVGILLFVIGGSSGFYLHDFYAILVGRLLRRKSPSQVYVQTGTCCRYGRHPLYHIGRITGTDTLVLPFCHLLHTPTVLAFFTELTL